MSFIISYLRILYKDFREEVLTLPSRFLALILVLLLFLIPVFMPDPYLLRILAISSIFAIYAASWDLLSGYTGQLSFGHAAFFGTGAYAAALLNIHFGYPPYLTIPIGCCAAVLTGAVVGIVCLRIRGVYLALATLAFVIILGGFVYVFPKWTGGELGIFGVQLIAPTIHQTYYVCLALCITSAFIMWKVTDSKIGVIFHAIREDEVVTKATGINVTKYKVLAYLISGFFAGLSGALYVHVVRIAELSAFGILRTFEPVIISIFGGVVSIYGAVGGAFILLPISEFMRAFSEQLRIMIYGLIVVVILLKMPRGIFVWLRDQMEEQCTRCKERNFMPFYVTRKNCRACGAEIIRARKK